MSTELWPHQKQTVQFVHAKKRVYDGSDPGTGKTAAHLAAYAARTERKRLLVVCPKTLMYTAWANDINRFFPQLSVSLAYSSNREEAFKLNTDVVVLNHDGIKWLAKEGKKYIKEFDHLICDEIGAFKWASSARSKAARAVFKKMKYVAGLNGTPYGTTVTELHNQIYLIDNGTLLGRSFTAFRNNVQEPKQVGPAVNHIEWTDKPEVGQLVAAMIKPISIRHQFEEVMQNVPATHTITRSFKMPNKVMRVYKQLEAELLVELDNATLTAVHAAALRSKLLQIASGAVYVEDGYKLIDTSRYELIAEQVQTTKHSVVFFNWKHQGEELGKCFETSGIEHAIIDGTTPDAKRQELVAAYQNGQFQALLLHPKTGAHGLTLTRGTQTILCSPIYEADVFKQLKHRIYRGGQTQATNTVCVQAEGTVEEYVYSKLNSRHEGMVSLLDYIKSKR